MSFFGDLLGAASKAVGGLFGGGTSSPVGGLLDKAGDALGGLIGDVTGDKLGDKIGDKIGDIIGSDKLGDKVGDLLGNAIGGESKVTDFLASKSEAIGDKLGDLFGSDKAGDVVGNVLGGMSEENVDPAAANTAADIEASEQIQPEPQPGKPAVEEPADTIDLREINGEIKAPMLEGAGEDIDLDFETDVEMPGHMVDQAEPALAPAIETGEMAMPQEQMML